MKSSFWSDLLKNPLVESVDKDLPTMKSMVDHRNRSSDVQQAYDRAVSQGGGLSRTYTAIAQGGGGDRIYDALSACVIECKLDRFYNSDNLRSISETLRPLVPSLNNLLINQWLVAAKTVEDLVWDLMKIALFDVCIVCDDSQDMKEEERIDDLKASVIYIVELLHCLGLSPPRIRFVNSVIECDNAKTASDINALFQRVTFNQKTPLAYCLSTKVSSKLVRLPMSSGTLRKPVLSACIICEPPAEDVDAVKRVIQENPRDVVRYSVAQIGTSPELISILKNLVALPQCDATENYDMVSQSFARNGLPPMAPELWIMKILLGPIDSSYAGLAQDD